MTVNSNRNIPKEHHRFARDMRAAGMKVYRYRGRLGWKGPAVSAGSIQDVIRSTKVQLQWDALGKGFVVYPVQPGEYAW